MLFFPFPPPSSLSSFCHDRARRQPRPKGKKEEQGGDLSSLLFSFFFPSSLSGCGCGKTKRTNALFAQSSTCRTVSTNSAMSPSPPFFPSLSFSFILSCAAPIICNRSARDGLDVEKVGTRIWSRIRMFKCSFSPPLFPPFSSFFSFSFAALQFEKVWDEIMVLQGRELFSDVAQHLMDGFFFFFFSPFPFLFFLFPLPLSGWNGRHAAAPRS